MSKTNTITLRIPEELKLRIEKIAKKQGVKMVRRYGSKQGCKKVQY